MRYLLTPILAALAIMVLTSPVQAKMAALCSKGQPAKHELACGQKNLWHAHGALRFLKSHPQAGSKQSRKRLYRDMMWLKRYATSHISAAHQRMRPSVPSCTDALLRLEGGYNPHATNPKSGAYGGPQALPGKKMKSAGADWQDNIWTQIRWMIGYVNGRYGGMCNALNHRLAYGWY